MANEKTPNYTAEQTAELKAEYLANPSTETVKALAEKMARSTASIIAKLTREGVYKKKEYQTKAGGSPVKKDALATELAELVGLSDGEADSLTKANKTALAKILAKLKN